MQSKITFKGLLFMVGMVGIAASSIAAVNLLGTRLYLKQVASAEGQIPERLVEGASMTSFDEEPGGVIQGLPIRLKIPEINVDTIFEYVGVTGDGAMAAPTGPKIAAWFDLGPRPGEVGSAVIAGHYGWKNRIPAVFDHLSKLKIGSKVFVVDESGTTTAFVVIDIKTYGEHDDASSVFGSTDEKARLNLITCQGAWNKKKKSYASRLVVFTEKVVTLR